MTLQVAVVRLLVVAHLSIQFWIIFYKEHFPVGEGIAQYAQLVFMALLCYTSFGRYRRDTVSLQKRLIFYAFLTWILRYYVNIVSHNVADIMSLGVVWLFVRSQTHVLQVPYKAQKQIDLSFVVLATTLLITGLARVVQPGTIPNMAHDTVFMVSHLGYIALVFIMYARAVVFTKDPTIRVRFFLLMAAALLYVGLFLSDFIWRSLAPGAVGNLPAQVKDAFGLLGMLSLFIAFNMSDSTRNLIILWHHLYRGHTQQRLISLVLQISEAVSHTEDHILPSLAVRVAKRMVLPDSEQRVVRQAAAILAIIHRNELPEFRQQWQAPSPCKKDTNQAKAQSPFEDRLYELERVQTVIDSLDLPYAVNRGNSRIETEILRVAFAYVLAGDLAAITAVRGVDYAPQVVDALAAEVGSVDMVKASLV